MSSVHLICASGDAIDTPNSAREIYYFPICGGDPCLKGPDQSCTNCQVLADQLLELGMLIIDEIYRWAPGVSTAGRTKIRADGYWDWEPHVRDENIYSAIVVAHPPAGGQVRTLFNIPRSQRIPQLTTNLSQLSALADAIDEDDEDSGERDAP